MQITINHPTSNSGHPVILNDGGHPMSYPDGIRLARAKLQVTAKELGIMLGVSVRTVNGWEGGRMPATASLNMLGKLLADNGF